MFEAIRTNTLGPLEIKKEKKIRKINVLIAFGEIGLVRRKKKKKKTKGRSLNKESEEDMAEKKWVIKVFKF